MIGAKKTLFSSKIRDCGKDQKQMFKLTCHLMGNTGRVILPTHESAEQLATIFGDFYIDKVATIRRNINIGSQSDTTLDDDVMFDGIPLQRFLPATHDEVKRINTNSPNKTCVLDPIPTRLLRQCLDHFVPLITAIINKSLATSVVPACFKRAVVRPLLKRPGLDKEVLNNYRPVSNLPYVSKLLEKVVEHRLKDHLDINNLHDFHHSAYRNNYSIETALVKVQNDIAEALDQKRVVVLVMLDLSSAFDVIDHGIMLTRLQHSFGVTAEALDWMRSYISGRTQCVSVGPTTSFNANLCCGVPQGSVLGPKLYCIYTKPVGDIVKKHNLHYHCYADDTQIYLSIKPDENWASERSAIEACVADVGGWMNRNMLKLNQEKSERIVFSSKHRILRVNDLSLTIGGRLLHAVQSVRNLGVIMDSGLTMEKQVNVISKSCFYHIRNIGKIRQYITNDACKILVQALVTSRLDYGNALLQGLPQVLIERLQRIQNCAARLITRSRKSEHITPVLRELHWLPVKYRLRFKVNTFTYKVLNRLAPAYMSDTVQKYQPTRSLRSTEKSLLVVPVLRTATYGERCFSRHAAILWNDLPEHIKQLNTLSSFKGHLKTHLFQLAYD